MAWDITGNAGTTSANFLGTTDRQPLVLKTNRSEVLRIDINGHVGIGTGHHKQILVGKWNDRNGLRGNLFRWDVRGWGNDYNYGIGARESDSLVYDTFQYHRWRVGTNEKMTLDGSGNLGIGAPSPEGTLHLGAPTPNVFLVGATTINQDGLRVHYNESPDLRTGVIDVKGLGRVDSFYPEPCGCDA
jgi:hypothetical protein